jgi:hypothetical protein
MLAAHASEPPGVWAMKAAVIVIVVMLGYLLFIGGIILFVVRRRRRLVATRTEALASVLAGSGGRLVGSSPRGGPTMGTEEEYAVGDHRVFTSNYYVNRSYYRFNLRVPKGPLPWLVVFQEGMVERVGKALGLNREVQTGDPEFDGVAYIDTIESDDAVQRVLGDAGVRRDIQRLLALEYKVQLSSRGVEAFHLYAQGTPPDLSGVPEAIGILADVAKRLPNLSDVRFRGAVPVMGRGVLAGSFAWIAFGVVAGFLDAFLHSPAARTLNDGHKPLVLFSGAILVWSLYVGVATALLRGHSYSFRSALTVAGLALFGAPILGVVLAASLNQTLDSSQPEAHTVSVTGTTMVKGKCRVDVTPWIPGATLSLAIGCSQRTRYPAGSSITLQAHDGALGMPWVEPLAP